MALIVATWLWGDKYPQHYVDRLRAGVARNLKQRHRFEVFAPVAEDLPLTEMPGCLCRLRMFDPAWQAENGIRTGDRLLCIDLDTIVTGYVDALVDRPEPFLILQGANSANPCPFNGSLMMLRAGAHREVWSDFSPARAQTVPFYDFPDDQGWLWHKIPDAAGWKAGSESGVYAFRKPGWPKGNALPRDARLVAFPGWRDPSGFEHLAWVKQHWRS